MDDIELLNAIEDLARELWRRHGKNGQVVHLNINQFTAEVIDYNGTTQEIVDHGK